VILVLLGLGAFYWFQTEQKRAQLTQRNLRDLARIARGIEAKTNDLEEIVAGRRPPRGSEDPCSDGAVEDVRHAIRICGLTAAAAGVPSLFRLLGAVRTSRRGE